MKTTPVATTSNDVKISFEKGSGAGAAAPLLPVDVPHKQGLSGPELIASIPDPSLEGYISRYDVEDLAGTFARVGIAVKEARTSVFGVGHVVAPGTIEMAIRDGQLYAMLPGKHAYRMHRLQPKPYETCSTIAFSEEGSTRSGRQEFEGGIILTLAPSEVGFAYNVPTDIAERCASDMGRGVVLIPPGTWVIRAPILVATRAFELTTTGRPSGSRDGAMSYIQTLHVGGTDLAKPRLVYVPYNHCAMFIDGNKSLIADQGFHWAASAIEIAGPWPQHEQRFTHRIEAKTLDNMNISIKTECWVQMVNPERYVRVAGKLSQPKVFVEDKLTAKVKQHVASINAMAIRAVEIPCVEDGGAHDAHGASAADHGHSSDVDLLSGRDAHSHTAMGVPVPSVPAMPATMPADANFDDDDQIIVTATEDAPTEFQVFNRMKSLLDEVRGFVDGRLGSAESLAGRVQAAISRAGLQLISLAALSVELPEEIAAQIQSANEEQIISQTRQATTAAKAQQHIATKYAEIRIKKADREEETKDAENQVTLQKSKARLEEAKEFAKRQSKRAEQKVQQNLELQALEHEKAREATRVENELAAQRLKQELELQRLAHEREAEAARVQMQLAAKQLAQDLEMQSVTHKKEREAARIEAELATLEREAALLRAQEEVEARRTAIAQHIADRENLASDVKAYAISSCAKAAKEKVTKQTLVDSIMKGLGKPMEGSKITTMIAGGAGGAGGAAGDGGEGGASAAGTTSQAALAMIPQLVALKEILGQTGELSADVGA